MEIKPHRTKKKKPNKQQREKQRAHDADTFNNGFKMGYEMGLAQGVKLAEEKFTVYAQRERLNWANRGR